MKNNYLGEVIKVMEDNKTSSPVVQANMKFFETLCKNQTNLELIKSNQILFNPLIEVMDVQKKDKTILDSATNILGKMASKKDFDNCVEALQKNKQFFDCYSFFYRP